MAKVLGGESFLFARWPCDIMPSLDSEERNVTTMTDVQPEAIVRAVLEAAGDDKVVLAVPNTDYRVHLVPTVPAAALKEQVGKRIKGIIHGNALRVHPSEGGGRFIEPVWGMPRIVAGKVLSVDEANRRFVVDLTVPFVITTLSEQQYAGIIEPGRLVNFYLQSGSTFTPVA
jgi:hypothetical protein